jgi:hypothetical protein
MAKKVKRKVSQVVTPGAAPDVMEVNTVNSTAAADTPAGRASSYRSRTTAPYEFNPDYSYVVKDLKRIGTLAGIFFVVLIVLSFIIR